MSNLNLTPEHIAYKKQVGNLKGAPVWQVLTTGGLYMNILGKNGTFDVIATGPHPAIAQHISDQKHPGIQWTGLSKSDTLDIGECQAWIPTFKEHTDRVNKRFQEIQEARNGR